MKEILKKYLEDLKKLYGEIAYTMIIVRTAIITYPFLQFYGFCFSNPIAIIVDKINVLKGVFNELGGCVSNVVSTTVTKSELKKELK